MTLKKNTAAQDLFKLTSQIDENKNKNKQMEPK